MGRVSVAAPDRPARTGNSQISGEPLNVIRAAPWIDDARRAAFLLQEDLRIARNAGGEIGRQSQRLVKRIGVQRLRMALCRSHCFNLRAHHIVEHVLRGEQLFYLLQITRPYQGWR